MFEASRFIGIVGAPRCGTTSLAGFLADHPDVCFSSVKEPHFFSQRDLSSLSTVELRRLVEAEYLPRYFADRPDGGAALAEGSISYLYAPEQMDPILRLWPDARFIIAVRDPLEMLPSAHQRLLYNGDEIVTDFERAWALAPRRAQGLSIPPSCIDARWLRYDEIGRLGAYVERFFQAVGRERCQVVLFDDLVADPARVYGEMLDFLDLPAHPRRDFTAQREGRRPRIGWLQRLLKRPPMARHVLAGEKFRRRVVSLEKRGSPSPLLRSVFAARKTLLRWNRSAAPRPPLSPALRREIAEALADDVALLSRLLGRDLGHWLNGTPQTGAARAAPATHDPRQRVGSKARPVTA